MELERRVTLKPDTDLVQILEDVHRDRIPRVIEREGMPLAVIVAPEETAPQDGEPTSRRNKERLLALAGAWRDLDVDRMIEDVYRDRHAAPPSPPVKP